jgi:diguanylate cyclase (GGDEF)-like protein
VDKIRPGSNPGFGTIDAKIRLVAEYNLRTDLPMKPLRKQLQSSDKISPSAKTPQTLINILKNKTPGSSSRSSKQNELPEIFLIPAQDIPPEQLKKIIKKGVVIKPKDDLINRLLKLEKDNRHLQSLSITDGLTGLYNRRFFNKQLKIEIARTKRTGEPFCLVLIDLDNFKSVNDNLGHAKGDEFLVKICRLISLKIRPTDFACRYGGDEFAVLLPETSLLDGIMIAQRWHELIKSVAMQMQVKVSSSIGVDEFDAACDISAEEFLDKVDQELYSAKRTGKNKISHPDLMRRNIAEAKLVTHAEKDTLYKAFAQLKLKKKKQSAKG